MRKKIGKTLKRSKKKMRAGDFGFSVLVLILIIFGIIMVFSASYYSSMNRYGNPYYYLIRELIFAFSGGVLLIFGASVDYHKILEKSSIIMFIGLLLLIVVLTPLGTSVNGAKRWIGAGVLTIMPGEIAKVCVIFFVAKYFGGKPQRIYSFKEGILPMFALIGICVGLVMMQPNMSTAITIAGIILAMMIVAGMNMKYLVALFGLGAGAMVALLFTDKGAYRMKRVVSFLDPFQYASGDGYQVVQSLLALGSGGLFGVGLGKSVQKTLYLPEPQNDFILAVIGEELGFIGILLLLTVYLLLIWRGVKIALSAPDHEGLMLGSGITAMIALQVLLNVAVATSSMPATGVILPFVSYGGNALWLFMFVAGVMLNISRQAVDGKTVTEPERRASTIGKERRVNR